MARRSGLKRILQELEPGRKVVLSTHLNADGDGAGSQAAAVHWLTRRGLDPTIVNPTPFPDMFRFLLADDTGAWTPADSEGGRAMREADVFLVLDTAEPSRLGAVIGRTGGRKVLVIDHHPATSSSIGDVVVCDPAACATGELVFDLIQLAGDEVTLAEADALYVAIATDTGSFRYANTSARTHEISADLLRAGVDPEAMYMRIYARYTPAGLDLVRRALERLRVADDLPIAWISLRQADLAQTGATKEDLEGIVEYARRIRGVRVAILFRELHDGRTKISLRSTGDADVAAVAREFGGGGHVKAAGAVVPEGLEAAEVRVLGAIREALS
ncbi:MAG: bifunctional oligoribonuclease/PAP phosphatase NrnA [Gemmatimonadetes bacterium]|nr:bifunctional oligoribonuclease/PAP phosphatase NrnA [Gemmatimonadota bacterium]